MLGAQVIIALHLVFSWGISDAADASRERLNPIEKKEIHRSNTGQGPSKTAGEHSLAQGSVNVQVFTEFEYDNKRIFVYAAKSNQGPPSRLWKFYYVPVLQPLQPANSEWVSIYQNRIRVDLIFGNNDIHKAARDAVTRKFDADVVKNCSDSWDIVPLIIDSFIARIVVDTQIPLQTVYPMTVMHPNELVVSLQFRPKQGSDIDEIKNKLIHGEYKIEIAFFFDGFYTVDTNMVSIYSNRLNSVLSSTKGKGDRKLDVQYIQRNQESKFVNEYLTSMEKVVYSENPQFNTLESTGSLTQQFKELFRQGIKDSEAIKLDVKFYQQIWSSDDLHPDRLTKELNRLFTLDKNYKKSAANSEKYYHFDQKKAKEFAFKASLGAMGFLDKFLGAGVHGKVSGKPSSKNAESNTTAVRLSQSDIEDALKKRDILVKWDGEKIIPKAFIVHKLSHIVDRIQTALVSKQVMAEKMKKATFRTVSAKDTPTHMPVALFPGEIRLYTSSDIAPPFNWLLCDGAAVSRTQYARLFQVIGTAYGVGDNTTTFNLPDLRGRFPLGRDEHQNRTTFATRLGDSGGEVQKVISVENLPSHTHDYGSFIVQPNGSHTHNIDGAQFTYSNVILSSETENTGSGFFLIQQNQTDVLTNATLQAIKIETIDKKLTNAVAGQHSHLLNGTSGAVGVNKEFSIINPFQTVSYIIYAG